MSASETFGEPYPGLRSFRRDETHIFFGRESTINEMVDRLAAHRFLAVIGSSGSGKSSLVWTGLLDALDRGLMAKAGSDWCVAGFRPGGQPLAELAAALVETTGVARTENDVSFVEAALASGPLGLVEWLEENKVAPQANLLLLVDQFEEIFRFRRGEARNDIDAFVALLLANAEQRDRRVYVVITMRSDFLGQCAEFAGLAEAINEGQFLTPRLSREQCQQAIEGPAAVYGGRVEKALVNALLNDAGTNADRLPLMQHALMRLWRIAQARSAGAAPVLTLADYERLGGIGEGGALSAHADEILAELIARDESNERLAAILFRALTESEGIGGRDVRRPIALSIAAAIAEVEPAALFPIVEGFRAPGRNLLTPPTPARLGPGTVVDISHESLIRQWKTLRDWALEESRSAQNYRELESTAKRWRDGQAALWTMPNIGVARAWCERERPNRAWAARYGDAFDLAMQFLDRSEEAEARRVEAERRRIEFEAQAARERAENAQRLAEIEAQAARKHAEDARRLYERTQVAAIVVSIFLIVAGFYAWLFFDQRQVAIKKTEQAEQNSKQAEHNFGLALNSTARLVGEVQRYLDSGAISVAAARELLKIAEGNLGDLTEIKSTLDIKNHQILALLSVSDAYVYLGDTMQARQRAEQAKGLAQQLVTLQPENAEWHRLLYASSFRIGDAAAEQGNLAAMRQEYDLALDVAKRFSARDPSKQDWQRDLALIQTKVGDTLKIQRKLNDALQYYRMALLISQQLAAKEPDKSEWQRNVATTRTRIGDVLVELKELDGALEEYRSALAIRQGLAGAYPDDASLQSNLSVGYNKIGDFLKAKGDLDGALAEYRKALPIRERLVRNDPAHAMWQSYLAIEYVYIGDVLNMKDDTPGAIEHYTRTLAIRQALANKDSSNLTWQRNLVTIRVKLGDVLVKQGHLDAALDEYRNALSVQEQVASKQPESVARRRELFEIHIKIGDALRARNGWSDALVAYEKALAIAEPFASRESAGAAWLLRLWSVRLKIGDALMGKGDPRSAVEQYRMALPTIERLVVKNPNDDNRQIDLAATHVKIGDALNALNDRDAALESYRMAREIWKTLIAKRPGNTEWERALAEVEQKIQKVVAGR